MRLAEFPILAITGPRQVRQDEDDGIALEVKLAYWFPMSEQELLARITSDPDICHGKPCLRGLRYPVEAVLEWLSGGMTNEEILADYEDLEEADLRAALAWAARTVRTKRIELMTA